VRDEHGQTKREAGPRVVDEAADKQFESSLRSAGRKPGSFWISRYVDYEWSFGRHLLLAYAGNLQHKRVLEFGCNYGATAIVLSHLGAQVDAVDVDPKTVELAQMNALRYGISNIVFRTVQASGALPYPDQSFDIITCNSVLEYVDPKLLADRLRDLDRLLKPGGLLLVLGTSNRLAPREVHSGRLFFNYLPAWTDRIFGWRPSLPRGVYPWTIARQFPGYRDLVRADRGAQFLEAKRRSGMGTTKLTFLRGIRAFGAIVGKPVGYFLPSIFLALQKPI